MDQSPTRRSEVAAIAAVIVLHLGLALSAARQESVTIDEFAHLPAGISYWRTGDFRLYSQSPPLWRLWGALPLAWSVQLPHSVGWKTANHWMVGRDFMYANAGDYQSLYDRARIFMSIAGPLIILLVWRWGRRLYGPRGGVAAAVLAGFCPNLLAHAPLVATDAGAALTMAAACFFFDRWCERRTTAAAALAGLMLGLGLLSKFTALLLLPLLPLLAAVRLWPVRKELKPAQVASAAAVMLLVALFVINTGYLWRGFGTPTEKFERRSPITSALLGPLPAWLPLPVPYEFINGFDRQSADNYAPYWLYLKGELSREGWWYYFPTILAAKLPLSMSALLLLGLAGFGVKRPTREETFALLPGAMIFLAIAGTSRVSGTLRYLLPAFPFLYLLGARATAAFAGRGPRMVAAGLVAAQVVTAVVAYPYFLSYFNPAAGGAERGHELLADSNLDWGQDLIRLKKYLARRPQKICLAYHGLVDPAVYGIDYELPRAGAECRLTAVSVNFLVGMPYRLFDHELGLINAPRRAFSRMLGLRPVDRVGTTIWVFETSPETLPLAPQAP